jgi:hypothetical protein
MTTFSCKNWLGMIVFFPSVGGYKYDMGNINKGGWVFQKVKHWKQGLKFSKHSPFVKEKLWVTICFPTTLQKSTLVFTIIVTMVDMPITKDLPIIPHQFGLKSCVLSIKSSFFIVHINHIIKHTMNENFLWFLPIV